MSSLIFLISIALTITFSNHTSKAANPPVSLTDRVRCSNNNLFSVSESSGELESRFRQIKPSFKQKTRGRYRRESLVSCLGLERCSRNGKKSVKKRPERKSIRILKQIRKESQVQFQHRKQQSSRYKKPNIGDKKFFFPPPWFIPPNPFVPPPSLFPPNPFAPPPSIFPPNPFQPPPPSIFPPLPFQPPPAPPPSIFPPLFPQPPPAPPPSIFPPNPFQPRPPQLPPTPPPSFFPPIFPPPPAAPPPSPPSFFPPNPFPPLPPIFPGLNPPPPPPPPPPPSIFPFPPFPFFPPPRNPGPPPALSSSANKQPT